jgi:uncharacterized protein YPO0396
MLSLTHIFLYNWHRFHDHAMPVEGSIYLAGHTGAGKSLLLDALQFALVGDVQRLRFCSKVAEFATASTAPEAPAHDQEHHPPIQILDSYVRGRLGDGRLLRPENCVGYIVLELTSTHQDAEHPRFMLGVCIEAGEQRLPACTFFIIPEAFDRRFFIHNRRPHTRQELPQSLQRCRDAQVYEHASAYQVAVRRWLGVVHERFFDLLRKALTFQPVHTIRHFVERWILEEHPLEIATLQAAVQRRDELQHHVQQVEEKLAALRAIIERQNEVKRLRDQHAEYTLFVALLRIAETEQHIASLSQQLAAVQHQASQEEQEHQHAQVTLKGAKEALFVAERERYRSDVARRREELKREIDHTTAEAEAIRVRWHGLRRDLNGFAQVVRPLMDLDQAGQPEQPEQPAQPAQPGHLPDMLPHEERDALRVLLHAIAALDIHVPPDSTLLLLIDSAIPKLDELLQRTLDMQAATRQQLATLREESERLEQHLSHLRSGTRTYPDTLRHLRDLVTRAIGEQPPLLCELLDIPDERWQNAIEALLGQHRFTLVVPPKCFDTAVQVLQRACQHDNTWNVGVLDIASTLKEEHRALPGSLAHQVQAAFPALRPYVDMMLGDTIACTSIEELRRHRRAITPDVLLCHNWNITALAPDHYQPWFIGERAQQSHIAAAEQQAHDLQAQMQPLIAREHASDAAIERLRHVRDLAYLRRRLDEPLDERPLREQIHAATAELEALDSGNIQSLEQEVNRLRGLFEQEQLVMERIIERQAQRTSQIQQLERSLEAARNELHEREQAAPDSRVRFRRDAEEQGEQGAKAGAASIWRLAYRDDAATPFTFVYAPSSLHTEPGEAIAHAQSIARDVEARLHQERQRLTHEAMLYNARYHFAAQPDSPDEERYATEQRRYLAHDLPRYRQQLEQNRQEIETALHEHVLHRLREQIVIARQQFERINNALARLALQGEYYRFGCTPTEELHAYHAMLEDLPRLGSGSLFESDYYTRHKATFDHFYQLVTRTPASDAERQQQQHLLDYRRYLTYDLTVLLADGRTSPLNSLHERLSSKDTQMPFYLTIAASFLQLYHSDMPGDGATLRLVLFDSAFAMMNQDHIAAVLELFQRFGLQVVLAAPLERCEYLLPEVHTALVLMDLGDTVLVEPYRNYEASMEPSSP